MAVGHLHHQQLRPGRWSRLQTDQSQSSLYWKRWPGQQKRNSKALRLFWFYIPQTRQRLSAHSRQRVQPLPWPRLAPVCWWHMSPSWRGGQLPAAAAGRWRPELHWCLQLQTRPPLLSGPSRWCWPDESHLEGGRASMRGNGRQQVITANIQVVWD